MDEMRDRLQKLYETIEYHATKVGRRAEEIKLVAVSKTHSIDAIQIAYELGLRYFGENYAQELREKASLAAQLRLNVEWHFIGRIQTNKVKYIVPVCEYIHSVWRVEELEEIDRIAAKYGKVQKVLIEVHTSPEESKAGVAPQELEELLEQAQRFPNVKVVGLMTMAPFVAPEETRPYFRKLFELRERLRVKYPDLVELSMGMTNDYTVAIEEGSTMLRIGTAIFGERHVEK
ncbi:YggS family pyridoxal phosphate enzyme [Fervidobacterium thailandense]|uniref:Pyridoxal phosphate homeostasis protein n=1 Tax=Fervidobacterium thailandense TaxID=1008305 RepID=A0A1E3G4X2_9BACT|nr:YggS family pyridoxal phosphate enzyme [Fervidobacterium thailandense]